MTNQKNSLVCPTRQVIMKFALLLFVLSSQAFAAFQVGERIFDTRSYVAGFVTDVLPKGAYNVKLDGIEKIRRYTDYYAEELGPKISPCDRHFCEGDSFQYTMPVVGQNRKGDVIEIFQGRRGMIIYGVHLEDENKIRYLNSDHLRWMKKN